MTPRPPYVSVVDPIGPAIDRVKTILFRPFDLQRWLVIGFCAWLAQLGESGGGGGGGGGDGGGGPAGLPGDIRNASQQARDYIATNADWLIPATIFVVAIVVALVLLVIWLSSRGRFMFLYCVAQNKAEVRNPWHLFRDHARSLFAFRIALVVIAFVTAMVFLVLGVILFFLADGGLGFTVLPIAGMVMCGLLFVAAIIVAAIIGKFTKDFVVPLMYLHSASAVQAWRMLLDVLSFNKARFALYILFQFVIWSAIAALVMAAGCLTCCCVFLVLVIPYVGTVLFLPVYVWQRSYSLLYLGQYGAQYYAIAPEPQPAGPPAP